MMNSASSFADTGDLVDLRDKIQEATGAPRHVLGILENIMRKQIIQSRCEWQTRADFDRGARRAYMLYRRDSDFFDAQVALQAATFQVLKAEAELAQVQTHGNAARIAIAYAQLESARTDLSAAQVGFDRIYLRSSP